MKLMKILGVLLLTLISLAGTALAADYAISSLEVNGESPAGSLHVEPGQKMLLHVNVRGLSATPQDVTLKAWLGGYEHELIETTSSMFRVREGVTYSKYLVLELPNDLDTNSNDYTLHVELYDANEVVEETFSLFVEEPRHNLQIQDVIMVPGQNVEAGKVMYVKVRVENMGYKKEEDIKVSVQVPELGVGAVTYIDELYPRNEDDNSQSANTLFLTIPDDAESGDYEMNVKVTYDREHATLQTTRLVYVDGKSKDKAESEALVSFDVSNTELKIGEVGTYKVLVANLGGDTNVYSVEVLGAGSWANVNVEPSMMSITESSTGEFFVKVNASEEGMHQFTLRVKEGDLIVQEKNVTVNVAQEKKSLNALWIGAGVLLVVLIVLIVLSQLQGDKVSKDDLEADTYYQPNM